MSSTTDAVYIRPLKIEDAQVSYQWRNNPKIWRFTGFKPEKPITLEVETEWLAAVLKRENERRFAICLEDNDRYIGNVFLTDLTPTEGILHTFIGEIEFWGKGRAGQAISQLFDFGFKELNLERILTDIHVSNNGSLTLANRLGMEKHSEFFDEKHKVNVIRFQLTRDMYTAEKHLEYFKANNSW